MILLDTNVIVGILRGNEKIANRFARHLGDVAIPAMSLGELYFGVAKSRNPAKTESCL